MYEQIRRDRRNDPQVSIRTLAERHRVHRREVRRALERGQGGSEQKITLRNDHGLAAAHDVVDRLRS